MSEKVIEIKDVYMKLNLSKERVDDIKEYFIKLVKKQLLYQEFEALKDISFDVYKGERVGIVGLNGAGKSTLLKVISGVLKPTKGSVKIKGSIAPLIELGAGFDNNYTARENIYLNGAILGFSKEFIKSKFDEIVEFSELGEFIDVPLKNYSSGMKARLGFSIATLVTPDILVVDEILSVGDFKFKEKSRKKLDSLIDEGTTVLFVSHSLKQVQEICNRVIWLEKGNIKMMGDAETVCNAYKLS